MLRSIPRINHSFRNRKRPADVSAGRFFLFRLGDHIADYRSVNIGQAKVPSGVAVRQLGVVEAEQMQDRGVQVMHMHRVRHRFEAEVVGCPMHGSPLDASSGKPHREAVMVMVAPVLLAGVVGTRQLHGRGTSELTAPNNQRFVEKPALL